METNNYKGAEEIRGYWYPFTWRMEQLSTQSQCYVWRNNTSSSNILKERERERRAWPISEMEPSVVTFHIWNQYIYHCAYYNLIEHITTSVVELSLCIRDTWFEYRSVSARLYWIWRDETNRTITEQVSSSGILYSIREVPCSSNSQITGYHRWNFSLFNQMPEQYLQ
jgi:hypothetical protein